MDERCEEQLVPDQGQLISDNVFIQDSRVHMKALGRENKPWKLDASWRLEEGPVRVCEIGIGLKGWVVYVCEPVAWKGPQLCCAPASHYGVGRFSQ